MNRTIWKYPIPVGNHLVLVDMPKDAKILHFGLQRNVPTLWALVNPENELEPRWFRIVGTGHPISEKGAQLYIGTVLMLGDNLVWHLFEARK